MCSKSSRRRIEIAKIAVPLGRFEQAADRPQGCTYQNWYNRLLGWSVEILNSAVLAELDAFPTDIRAKLDHIVGLIEELGIDRVREPYVKHLRGQLWEMRMKGHSGLGRAIYVTQTGRRIIILHAFRKQTSKTPKTAIRTALSRMKELDP